MQLWHLTTCGSCSLPASRPLLKALMCMVSLYRAWSHVSTADLLPAPCLQSAQLAEHHLHMVTTSATCDDMFGFALDTFSEDFGDSGEL